MKSLKGILPISGNARSAYLVSYLQPFVTLTIVLINGIANMRNMRKANLYMNQANDTWCEIDFATNGNVIFFAWGLHGCTHFLLHHQLLSQM